MCDFCKKGQWSKHEADVKELLEPGLREIVIRRMTKDLVKAFKKHNAEVDARAAARAQEIFCGDLEEVVKQEPGMAERLERAAEQFDMITQLENDDEWTVDEKGLPMFIGVDPANTDDDGFIELPPCPPDPPELEWFTRPKQVFSCPTCEDEFCSDEALREHWEGQVSCD